VTDLPGLQLRPERDGLLLRIEVIPMGAANPLIREEAECSDFFAVVHELERVTGPRLRRRIHEAAATNLLRLNPQ
jgi:hypothetical protein